MFLRASAKREASFYLRARPKAERVLLRIRENPEYERPAGRPAGRGHAFERLISLEPKARLTGGLLWWVPPSLLPCMGPMPNHASTHCGTWRVLPGVMSQMFHLLFLGNGWADCVEIWHAVEDQLVTAYAVITGGVSLHVRTCRDTPTPRFCISETARPIVFKFGMGVGGH